MTWLTTHKRALFALFALLSLIANGAQAHVGMSLPDQIAMPVCGMGADAVIVIANGEPALVNVESESCCGDCAALDITPIQAPDLKARYAPMVISYPAQPVLSYTPSAPLWPGAPPHGPPSSSDL